MDQLRVLAEDPRHRVRESVVNTLVEASRLQADALVALLGRWTDGYLGAAVALDALTARPWLDRSRSAEPSLARFDEAFSLIEDAPRADRRSQGYRTLVKALVAAPAKLLDRFPAATLTWLESRAGTTDETLREALTELLDDARARGHGVATLEHVEKVLADGAKPRRDPRTYVGPTRKRGTRRR
jgi:hypothetical protein